MADKTKYFDYDTVKEMLYDLEYEGKEVEPSDYPYIEIADEHGDLIDRDALKENAKRIQRNDTGFFIDSMSYDEALSRAVDEAEVVLERTT